MVERCFVLCRVIHPDYEVPPTEGGSCPQAEDTRRIKMDQARHKTCLTTVMCMLLLAFEFLHIFLLKFWAVMRT